MIPGCAARLILATQSHSQNRPSSSLLLREAQKVLYPYHGRSIRNFNFFTAAVRGPEGIVSVSLCEFVTVTAAPFVIARSSLLLELICQLDVTREKSASRAFSTAVLKTSMDV